MATQVKGRNGTFIVGGATYTTPRGQGGSNFRFGLFNENGMVGGVSEWTGCGSASRADVDRDAVCGENIALLWDGDEKVWVDTNQDRSFANEKAMEQFSKNRDFGILGTDNPATTRRETVPFTVQADEKSNRVNLGVVAQAHGTHVAGIAAGKDFMGGVWDGVAPEAQIVAVNVCVPQGGCTLNGLIEGMTYAIADAKVDVANMSIGGLSALNDGNSVFGETYKRLMRDHNVQLFLSAGNSGPGFNTIGSPSDTDGVMSVGAARHEGVVRGELQHHHGAGRAAASVLLARTARERRVQAEHHRSGQRNLDRPGMAGATVPRAGRLPAGVRHVQRDLDGCTAGDGRGSAPAERGQVRRCRGEAVAVAPRDDVERPLHPDGRCARAGRRHHQRPGRMGAPEGEELQGGRHRQQGDGEHGPQRPARRRPTRVRESTSVRAGSRARPAPGS